MTLFAKLLRIIAIDMDVSQYMRNYKTIQTCLLWVLLVLLVAVDAAPRSDPFRDVAHMQEHIRVIKVGALNPFIEKYRQQRYNNDIATIRDLEKWAETSYTKEVKELPEIAPHLDFRTQLSALIRQAHENCAWMVLWMSHIASQEMVWEHGANYKKDFMTLEQLTTQLMLRLEIMAQSNGVELAVQLKDMHLNSPPEFNNTSLRRHHHYIQLYHHNLLMNAISERFITLESHVNTIW